MYIGMSQTLSVLFKWMYWMIKLEKLLIAMFVTKVFPFARQKKYKVYIKNNRRDFEYGRYNK